MDVKRLNGRLLNYWVAQSAALALLAGDAHRQQRQPWDSGLWHPHSCNPANDWSHAGPIISAEWLAIDDMLVEWFGVQWSHIPAVADHPLTWFLRAYVATRFGDEVEDLDSAVPPSGGDRVGDEDLARPPPAQPRPKSWLQLLWGRLSW